jgi:RNA polymerase sigma factor (sigma-70 family)
VSIDIQRLQELDDEEWRRLEEAYAGRIRAYLQRQVGHPDTAADLTQEVFLGAVRGIGNFDSRYNLEQFLMGIARNKGIDHLRRKKLETQVPDDADTSGFFGSVQAEGPSASELLLASEKVKRQRKALTEALREAMASIRAEGHWTRLMAIELAFLTQLRHREIARLAGFENEQAIAGIKFRAIRDLQGRLRKRDPRMTLFSGLWKHA